MEEMAKHGGEGVSTRPEDSLVPLIYVLDSKSVQCDERGSSYIPGAKGGSILLRNFGVVDGQVGISFQPCSKIWIDWVEWVPRERGGGFVARHPCDESDPEKPPRHLEAMESPHPENPNKKRWMRPNGNEVRQTRNVAGYVLTDSGDLPFVIPFASTGHTVAKGWNFTMMSHLMPNGKSEPVYARRYRLKTVPKTNSMGKWYAFEISDEGYVSTGQFQRGMELYNAFKTGQKQVEEEVPLHDDGDDSM